MSDRAIGAVLSQVQDGVERPICYGSQLYDKHQQNYNVTRKELLALVTFVKKFRQYLFGRPFTIITDHAALQWLRRTPEPIGQQARWVEILEEFDFEVEHHPGARHGNADSPSRHASLLHAQHDGSCPPVMPTVSSVAASSASTPVTAAATSPSSSAAQAAVMDWPAVQQSDPIVGEIYNLVQNGSHRPAPESVADRCSEMKALCSQYDRLIIADNGILCRTFVGNETGRSYEQIIVPQPLRREIADELHRGLTGGHLGHRRAKLLLQKRCFWPGWATDVYLAKKRCLQCARHQKPNPRKQGQLQPMLTGEPWERLGVDVTGPHPTSSKGNKYVLTVIDHFTKWVELFPMRNQEAPTVARILMDRVICQHGLAVPCKF